MKDNNISDKNETITFSIILPTKNRLEILPFSIGSVLSQSYENWELILVDNGDGNRTHEVRKLVDQYNDSRIHLIKTGGLSALDNWNEGYKHAHGEYAILLRDKCALIDGGLALLAKIINTYSKPEAISWPNAFMHPISGIISEKGKCMIESVSTAELLNEVFSFNLSRFGYLDNKRSIIRMDLTRKLYNSPPNRIFSGSHGDVANIYRNMCYCNELLRISVPLCVQLMPFSTALTSKIFVKEWELRSVRNRYPYLSKYLQIEENKSDIPFIHIVYDDLLRYDAEYGEGELINKLQWDNYYKVFYKEYAPTLYWHAFSTHGFGSAEEKGFRQNILKYYPEFYKEHTPALYWHAFSTHGFGSAEEKDFRQNILKYYPEFYKKQAPTLYWQVVLMCGLGSTEEQEFKQNILKYYPEFLETPEAHVSPHWYGYLYWKLYWKLYSKLHYWLVQKIPNYEKVRATFMSAIRDPMSLRKRMSMITLGILTLFFDDDALIPFYARHARKFIPIQGHICETLELQQTSSKTNELPS